jgi:pyruvate,orthophosphate dikinase
MILADNEADRRKALDKLLPLQRDDFYGVFKAMKGCPVTIRTIDPPLHEFLPKREDLMVDIAKLEAAGKGGAELKEKKTLLHRVEQLHEFNPMLGHRGVRLGITYPEITEMQTKAIISAACQLKKEGHKVLPEIMIPLVGHVNELIETRRLLDAEAHAVVASAGEEIDFKFGTMIEIPRAVWVADKIAEHAEFFSFGTNDLTQMTFGYSRDDAEGGFLLKYVEEGILPENPFQTLDDVIADEMQMAVDRGRSTRPDLKVGICGEHGGDPASIHKCEKVGLNYVSCSPFRVPVARLEAGRAALGAESVGS